MMTTNTPDACPSRGRRRDESLGLPSGPTRVYPAFTAVERLGECQTVRKVGYVAAVEAHVRLVHHELHGLLAVKTRKGRWWLIEEPGRKLLPEQRSFQGRLARRLVLKV